MYTHICYISAGQALFPGNQTCAFHEAEFKVALYLRRHPIVIDIDIVWPLIKWGEMRHREVKCLQMKE